MARRNHLGWTLVELMMGLAVSSVVTGFVVPAFRETLDRGRLLTAANQLASDMAMARQRGILRNAPVTFCAGDAAQGCTGNWSARRWIVFIDFAHDGRLDPNDIVVSRTDLSTEAALVIAGNGPFNAAILFDPIGMSQMVSGAFGAGTLRVCIRGGRGDNATDLLLAASGRVRSETKNFSGNCPSP